MRGHTLVELIFVLLLTGVAVSSVAPAARRQGDRTAVVAAREAVVGLIAEARVIAMERGGARVRIVADPPLAELHAGGTLLRTTSFGAKLGVSIFLAGANPEAELAYDALGLGRVASQTIVFRRGGEVTELVVSAYGRVRRR